MLAMGRRTYTDEEKAVGLAALKLHGGDLSKAARAAGVPRKTLDRWRHSAPETVRQIGQQKTADLAAMELGIVERSTGISIKALDAIDAEPMTVALALAVLPIVTRSGGVAFDKYQLATGGATARVEHEVIIDAGDDGRA